MRDSFNPGVFFAQQNAQRQQSSKPNNFSNLLGSQPINLKKEQTKSNKDTVDLSELLGNDRRQIGAKMQRSPDNTSMGQVVNILLDIKQLIQRLIDGNTTANYNNLSSVLNEHLKKTQLAYDEHLDDINFIRQDNLKQSDFERRAFEKFYINVFERYTKDFNFRQFYIDKNISKVAKKYNMTVGSVNVYTHTSNQIIGRNQNTPPEVLSVMFLSSIHELLRHFALDFVSHSKGMKQGDFVKDLYESINTSLVQELKTAFFQTLYKIPIIGQLTSASLGLLLKGLSAIPSMVTGLYDFYKREKTKDKLVRKYSSQKSPEIRTADAITKVPGLLESQRVVLLSIQEVLQNIYAQDNKLLHATTGQTYSYKGTQNKRERVYVEELGQFLTKDEYTTYSNDKKKAIYKDTGRGLRGTLFSTKRGRDKLTEAILKQSQLNNSFQTDDALSQLMGNDFTQTGKIRKSNRKVSTSSGSGANPFDHLEIAVIQTGADIIKKLNDDHSEFMSVFKKQFNIQLASVNKNIRDYGKEQVKLLQELIDTVRTLKFKKVSGGEIHAFAQGGIYSAGKVRLVGEKGPEIEVPKVGGKILSNKQVSELIAIDYNKFGIVMTQAINVSNIGQAALPKSANSTFNQMKAALDKSQMGLQAKDEMYLSMQERLAALKERNKPAVKTTALVQPSKKERDKVIAPKKDKGWFWNLIDGLIDTALTGAAIAGFGILVAPIVLPLIEKLFKSIFGDTTISQIKEKVLDYVPDFVEDIFTGKEGFFRGLAIATGSVLLGPSVLKGLAFGIGMNLHKIIKGVLWDLPKAMIKFIPTIVEFIPKLFNGMIIARNWMSFLSDLMGSGFKALGSLLTPKWLSEIFTKQLFSGTLFSKIIGTIAKIPLKILGGAFSVLVDGIFGAIEGFKESGFLGGLQGFIKGALTSSSIGGNMLKYALLGLPFAPPFGPIIGALLGGAIQFIFDNWGNIKAGAGALWDGISGMFGDLWNYISSPFISFFKPISDAIGSFGTEVSKFFSSDNQILAMLNDLWGTISSPFRQFFEFISTKINEFQAGLIENLSTLPMIGNLFKDSNKLIAEKTAEMQAINDEVAEKQTEIEQLSKLAKDKRASAGTNTDWWVPDTPEQKEAQRLEELLVKRQEQLGKLQNNANKISNQIVNLQNQSTPVEKRQFGGPVVSGNWYSAAESGLEVFVDKSGKSLKLLGASGPELFQSTSDGDIYPIQAIVKDGKNSRISLNTNNESSNAYLNSASVNSMDVNVKGFGTDIPGVIVRSSSDSDSDIISKLDELIVKISAFHVNNMDLFREKIDVPTSVINTTLQDGFSILGVISEQLDIFDQNINDNLMFISDELFITNTHLQNISNSIIILDQHFIEGLSILNDELISSNIHLENINSKFDWINQFSYEQAEFVNTILLDLNDKFDINNSLLININDNLIFANFFLSLITQKFDILNDFIYLINNELKRIDDDLNFNHADLSEILIITNEDINDNHAIISDVLLSIYHELSSFRTDVDNNNVHSVYRNLLLMEIRDLLKPVEPNKSGSKSKSDLITDLLTGKSTDTSSLLGYGDNSKNQILVNAISGIRGKGGSIDVGKTYLAGESGPELLLNSKDGTYEFIGSPQLITAKSKGDVIPISGSSDSKNALRYGLDISNVDSDLFVPGATSEFSKGPNPFKFDDPNTISTMANKGYSELTKGLGTVIDVGTTGFQNLVNMLPDTSKVANELNRNITSRGSTPIDTEEARQQASQYALGLINGTSPNGSPMGGIGPSMPKGPGYNTSSIDLQKTAVQKGNKIREDELISKLDFNEPFVYLYRLDDGRIYIEFMDTGKYTIDKRDMPTAFVLLDKLLNDTDSQYKPKIKYSDKSLNKEEQEAKAKEAKEAGDKEAGEKGQEQGDSIKDMVDGVVKKIQELAENGFKNGTKALGDVIAAGSEGVDKLFQMFPSDTRKVANEFNRNVTSRGSTPIDTNEAREQASQHALGLIKQLQADNAANGSSPSMPGMGVNAPSMPGMGGSRPSTSSMPGMGSPNIPGMGGPNIPGMGGPNAPGMGGPNIPGMGGPNAPGMGGPNVPGMGGPNAPGMGGPNVPGMGGPNVPGMGGPGSVPGGMPTGIPGTNMPTGAPGGQPSGNELVTIRTQSGKTAQVAAKYAPNFQGFINELEANGYQIKSLGGYADRNAVGSNKKSYHAFGAAIDINPSQNPYSKTFQSDMPSNVGEIAKKYGLGWGGNWKSVKDPMHFSMAKSEGGTEHIDRNSDPGIVRSKGGNTSNGVNPDVTQFASSPVNNPMQQNTQSNLSGVPQQYASQYSAIQGLLGGGGISAPSMPGMGRGGMGGMASGGLSGMLGGMLGGYRPNSGGQMMGGSGGQMMGGTSDGMIPASNNGPMSSIASGMTGSVSSTKDANVLKPELVGRLSQDLNITPEQAAGIVGNLAHESGNFKYHQELNPRSGRGGIGWAQWTGPRRRAFEKFAAEKGLDVTSNEASYQFLKHELNTTEKGALAAVRRTSSAQESAQAFEGKFERAGVKHYASRFKHADQALAAYKQNAANNPQVAGQLPANGDPSQQAAGYQLGNQPAGIPGQQGPLGGQGTLGAPPIAYNDLKAGKGLPQLPPNVKLAGSAARNGLQGVDPALVEGVLGAAKNWKGRVEITSGMRGKGDRGNHSDGAALDVQLYDEKGQKISNIGSKPKPGEIYDPQAYETFMKDSVAWGSQYDPSLSKKARWGGYFGGSVPNDYMHIDTKVEKGSSQGSWDKGRIAGDTTGLQGKTWEQYRQERFGSPDPNMQTNVAQNSTPTTNVNNPPIDPTKQADPATWQPGGQTAANSPTTGVTNPPKVASNDIQIDESLLKQDMQNGNLSMFASTNQGMSDVTDINNPNAMVGGYGSKSTARGVPSNQQVADDIARKNGVQSSWGSQSGQPQLTPEQQKQAVGDQVAKQSGVQSSWGSQTGKPQLTPEQQKQAVGDQVAKQSGVQSSWGSQTGKPQLTPEQQKQAVGDQVAKQNGVQSSWGSQTGKPQLTPEQQKQAVGDQVAKQSGVQSSWGSQTGKPQLTPEQQKQAVGDQVAKQNGVQSSWGSQTGKPQLTPEQQKQAVGDQVAKQNGVQSSWGSQSGQPQPLTSGQKTEIAQSISNKISTQNSPPSKLSDSFKVENSEEQRKKFMGGTQSKLTTGTTPPVQKTDAQRRQEFMNGSSGSSRPKYDGIRGVDTSKPTNTSVASSTKETSAALQPTANEYQRDRIIPTGTDSGPPKLNSDESLAKQLTKPDSKVVYGNPNDQLAADLTGRKPGEGSTSDALKQTDSEYDRRHIVPFDRHAANLQREQYGSSGNAIDAAIKEGASKPTGADSGPPKAATESVSSTTESNKASGTEMGPPTEADSLEKDLEASVNAGPTDDVKLEQDLADSVDAGVKESSKKSSGGGSKHVSSGGGSKHVSSGGGGGGYQQPSGGGSQMPSQQQYGGEYSAIQSLFGGIGQNVGAGFGNMLGQAGGIIGGFGGGLMNQIGNTLGGGLNQIGNTLGSGLNQIGSGYPSENPAIMSEMPMSIPSAPPQTQFDVQGLTNSTMQSSASESMGGMMGGDTGDSSGMIGGEGNSNSSSVIPESMFSSRHNSQQPGATASGMNRDDMGSVAVDPLGDDIANRLFSLLAPSLFYSAKNQAMETKQNNYIENIFI